MFLTNQTYVKPSSQAYGMIGSFTAIQNDRTQFKKETLPKSHINSHVNSILFPSIEFIHGRFNIVGFEPTYMGKKLNPG